LARGMNPEEIQKLRNRVDKIRKDTQKASGDMQRRGVEAREGKSSRTVTDESYRQDSLEQQQQALSAAEKTLSELRSKIFGAALFSNSKLTFEPNLRLATPKNYQIGPDDELLIDIYGYSEASYNLTVS